MWFVAVGVGSGSGLGLEKERGRDDIKNKKDLKNNKEIIFEWSGKKHKTFNVRYIIR